jgi:hypothetical protein
MLATLDSAPDDFRPCATLKQNGEFSDAVLTVAARFPMTWVTGEGEHPFPFDLDGFVEAVEEIQEDSVGLIHSRVDWRPSYV